MTHEEIIHIEAKAASIRANPYSLSPAVLGGFAGETAALATHLREVRQTLLKMTEELNKIRARSGVPYDREGYRSNVEPAYFSALIDEGWERLK